MRFEKIGELSIEFLSLEAAPDIDVSPSYLMFRSGDNIVVQVLRDKRVFMDCTKEGQADTYEGTCSEEEYEQLVKMMENAIEQEEEVNTAVNLVFPKLSNEPIALFLYDFIPAHDLSSDYAYLHFRYGEGVLVLNNTKPGMVKMLSGPGKERASVLDGTCDRETFNALSEYFFADLEQNSSGRV